MGVIEDRVQLEPGQYASIFISERPLDPPGYGETMVQVMAEAEQMGGYIGFESLRDGRDGVFISYWQDRASVDAWAAHMGHRQAKARGVSEWYDAFRVVLCKVEHTRWFRRAVSPKSA
ncbi:MAG: antibiotic biosynthesis monooxygenase [Flavobacteriales bacterium]|jgi:heme-degrading monooxygenase HmoA|nr:antibiotic biosynthesis monooxygenase [Flavobacteriales bacterium]